MMPTPSTRGRTRRRLTAHIAATLPSMAAPGAVVDPLEELKSRDDLGHSEIVADFEAVNPAHLQQILEYSEQLQEWQGAVNRATEAMAP